eukprot:COSAG05_NODE_3322_length_2150_cov_1.173086_3_plen_97_part_00
MTTTKLGGQFVRRLPSAMVDFNAGRSENPVVTHLPGLGWYHLRLEALCSEEFNSLKLNNDSFYLTSIVRTYLYLFIDVNARTINCVSKNGYWPEDL